MTEYNLKLKQKSIAEAREYIDALLENAKTSRLKRNVLIGYIDDDNNFSFSSRAKGSALTEFVGKMEMKEDGIYLIGHIRPKKGKMTLLYAMSILNVVIAIMLMLSQNPIFMLVSVLFLIVPVLNIWVTNKGFYLKASLRGLFGV